jgi:hypothetical protein
MRPPAQGNEYPRYVPPCIKIIKPMMIRNIPNSIPIHKSPRPPITLKPHRHDFLVGLHINRTARGQESVRIVKLRIFLFQGLPPYLWIKYVPQPKERIVLPLKGMDQLVTYNRHKVV